MKITSRTQRQLNDKRSKVRHQDHQVHRPRNTKYTDEVREGSIIPAVWGRGGGGGCVRNAERRKSYTAQPPSLLGTKRNSSSACSKIHHTLLMKSELVLFVLWKKVICKVKCVNMGKYQMMKKSYLWHLNPINKHSLLQPVELSMFTCLFPSFYPPPPSFSGILYFHFNCPW